MKWIIDEDVLTMSDSKKIPEFKENWAWIGKDEIIATVGEALKVAGHGNMFVWNDDVMQVGRLKLTKDHFEPCLWVEDCVVRAFDMDAKKPAVAIVGYNLTDALNGTLTSAYVQWFVKAED